MTAKSAKVTTLKYSQSWTLSFTAPQWTNMIVRDQPIRLGNVPQRQRHVKTFCGEPLRVGIGSVADKIDHFYETGQIIRAMLKYTPGPVSNS